MFMDEDEDVHNNRRCCWWEQIWSQWGDGSRSCENDTAERTRHGGADQERAGRTVGQRASPNDVLIYFF